MLFVLPFVIVLLLQSPLPAQRRCSPRVSIAVLHAQCQGSINWWHFADLHPPSLTLACFAQPWCFQVDPKSSPVLRWLWTRDGLPVQTHTDPGSRPQVQKHMEILTSTAWFVHPRCASNFCFVLLCSKSQQLLLVPHGAAGLTETHHLQQCLLHKGCWQPSPLSSHLCEMHLVDLQALLQPVKPVFLGPVEWWSWNPKCCRLLPLLLLPALLSGQGSAALDGWPGSTRTPTALTKQVRWEPCKRSKPKTVVTENTFCSVQWKIWLWYMTAHWIAVVLLPDWAVISVWHRKAAPACPLQVSSQALVIADVHTCMPLPTYALPFHMLPETGVSLFSFMVLVLLSPRLSRLHLWR